MDKATIEKIVELTVAGKEIAHPAGGTAVLLPDGFGIQTLEPAYTPGPFIYASPALAEADSFVAYVNEFKNEGTRIFADLAGMNMTACIDYHRKGSSQPNKHFARLELKHSPEWKAWSSIAGDRHVDQVAFAEFIEEQAHLIRTPPGAELLEMVTNLQSNTKVEFSSKVNIANGKVQLTYNEIDDTKAGAGKLPIPQKLEVALGIFQGEPRDPFDVLLRTRINQGKLYFMVKIDQSENKTRAAFKAIMDRIAEATGLPVLAGAHTGRY